MAYKAEVLFRQGWHVTVHWSQDEAVDVADARAVSARGTANPPIMGRVRELVTKPPVPPTITFDEYCDSIWPNLLPLTQPPYPFKLIDL